MELSQTESKSLLTSTCEILDKHRNQVIEEVAREIEKMTSFGTDTIDSLAIYIRGMKK
jgi:predicted HTH domain antitoxin